MKTSPAIATAFILGGAALALLRWNSPAPVAQAVDAVPPAARFSLRTATTHPSPSADTAVKTPKPRTTAPTAHRVFTSAIRSETRPPLFTADTAAVDPGEVVPMAREALSYVGVDTEADDFWAMAINDPDLSSDDRSDLIEDLNETGFADPNHITSTDLPMIEKRLELIESMAPDSMDEVNAAAFAEAYKDLSRMRDELAPASTADGSLQLTVQ